MSTTESVLRLTNVTKRFGQFQAVHDISFSVASGEVVGFVGANGAGKTTTISMILGFLRASEGTVEVEGQVVTPTSAHRSHRRIGYAAGDMELPGGLTGEQYLDFVLSQANGDHTEATEALLKRFHPQLGKKIRSLSRGNKQKIALVAAFMTEPDIIILDEPTSGLDPVMQEVFLEYVRELQAAGKTVFMSSHYLQEVTDVCSRIILMSHGRIVEDAQTIELLASSGKRVHVQIGGATVRLPAGAEEVTRRQKSGMTDVEFIFKGDIRDLQRWLAQLKQVKDFEISEYNLDGMFASLYEPERGEDEEAAL